MAARSRDLKLLLLFGSRAREEAGESSDWDLGYIGGGQFDAAALLAELVYALGCDRVDLVDLQRANGLLRFRAARDGIALYETTPGTANEFRYAAASFWCDALPVLQRGYDDILAEV